MSKFVMSDDTAKAMANGIRVGSIWARLAVYFIQYIVLFVFLVFFVNQIHFFSSHSIPSIISIPIIIISPMIPFFLVDWSIRRQRRKNGFSVWGDITEEIKQRKVDEQVAREMKAHEKFSKPKSEGKDLDYWFGMLEKGAITKEQYEAKRDELLKS